MGLHSRASKLFLRISDGKIRQKSDKEDKLAEERYTEIDKQFHYERVYSDCEGYIRNIAVSTHEEFGTTYNLELLDLSDGQTFSIGISETSRYFQSLACHLPNIDFSKRVVVAPYSFKNNGRAIIGISFKQDGVKVSNYYRKVVDPNSTPPLTESCNGLERFDFTSDDKDERKIEALKQMKFLKKEIKTQIIRLQEFVEANLIDTLSAEEEEKDVETKTATTVTPTRSKADSKKPVDDADYEEEEDETYEAPKNRSKSTAKAEPPKSKGRKKPVDDDDDLPY